MKLLHVCASLTTLAALMALTAISGCKDKSGPPAGDTSPISAPSSGPSADNSSTKGIIPSPSGTAPAVAAAPASSAGGSSAVGPAAGHTAIGGLAGGQEKGGATSGGVPAPTAGDGKSAAPAK